MADEPYSAAQGIAAEGSRIGFVHCNTCGAAVMLDMQVDAMKLHAEWHAQLIEDIVRAASA